MSFPEVKADRMARIRCHCDEIGDCLIWNRGLNSQGYPQARLDGKPQLVGRYVYEAIMGKAILRGRVVTTRCGNKLCVSDACLYQLTYSDRQRRDYKTGRRSHVETYRSHVRTLENAGRTKLSFAIAQHIRENRSSEPRKALALEYGVTLRTMDKVFNGKSWRIPKAANDVFQWAQQQ